MKLQSLLMVYDGRVLLVVNDVVALFSLHFSQPVLEDRTMMFIE